MLVEALAEFEQARKIARPDMLIDPEEWRISIVSRTEELNRILDPKPMVTREGVRFHANPLLIRRERDRTPRPDEMARDNSYQGEEALRTNRKAARAAMDYGTDDKIKAEKSTPEKRTEMPTASTASDSGLRDEVKQDAERAAAAVEVIERPTTAPVAAESNVGKVIVTEEVTTKAIVGEVKQDAVAKEEKASEPAPTGGVDEDAVSKVVDEIVRERLNAGSK